MIALIEFQNISEHSVMLRSEAVRLNIRFEEVTKLGINHNGNLEAITKSWQRIQGVDCFQTHLEKDDDTWYTPDGKKVEYFYVYKPAPAPIAVSDYVTFQKENLVDLCLFASVCKLPYTIKKSVQPTNDMGNLQHILNTVEQKLERLSELSKSFYTQFNEKCDMHVGGGRIATFNEVKLLENSCTDVLQTELANGWRIIACCVQPDQRRPDYILGRYNPEIIDSLSAKR